MIIDPSAIPHSKLHAWLQSAIIPRPIAFASTVDNQGNINLSPFSFFNVFGSNPPTLVFSPSRRGRDNTTKHTYQNVKEVPEVVINMVSYAMVEQVSLSSCEYPKGVNEFLKSGFTAVPSSKVKPPRVAESSVAFECRVREVKELGDQGGAGNLVICEVLLMHVKDEVLDDQGRIDPLKMDLVARMGGDLYLRMQKDGIFIVPKPNEKLGIGFDALPKAVRESTVLTGNELGRLANVSALPDTTTIKEFQSQPSVQSVLQQGTQARHRLAQYYLRQGKTEEAWKVLLD
ncbi:MAG: flavin reductase family protein [Bacteroidetes bacterium]|nr:flavin reductase family protein [Bacteroidota bacterium]